MSKLYARCRSLLAASIVAVAACGNGGGGVEPDLLTPEQVAGNYRICELAFVPEGGVPAAANIVAALDTAAATRLEIGTGAEQRQFSLLYRLRDGGTTQIVSGSYVPGSQHVDLPLGTAPAARRLLLPEQLRLTFDPATRVFTVGQEQAAYEIAKSDYEALVGEALPPAIRDRFSGRLTGRLVHDAASCS